MLRTQPGTQHDAQDNAQDRTQHSAHRHVALLSCALLLGLGCRSSRPEPAEPAPDAARTHAMETPDTAHPWPDAAGDVRHPELAAIAAELWEQRMREHPVWATRTGDPRYHDRLSDITPEGFARRHAEQQQLLARLAALDPTVLQPEDRVTHAVLLENLGAAVAEREQGYEPETFEVDPVRGPQIGLLSLAPFQPAGTARERELLLARWRAIPDHVDQHTANLRRGLAAGRVASESAVRAVIGQLDALLAVPVHDDPLVEPLRELEGLADDERARFEEQVLETLAQGVRPAFARYRAFLAEELAPRMRTDERPGLGALPGGQEHYTLLARRHTTLDLAPAAIHAIGLEQVARVRAEMEALGASTFDTPSFESLRERMRSDPALAFETPAQIVAAAREHLARAEAAVPAVIGRLPRTPCEVHEIPAHEAPGSTTAYYMPPAADGSRPGRYYVNTFEPWTRPRYEAAVLAYHESVPGHHTQIALAMELTGLPLVRRHGGVTAYVEGWALYTERLAEELGLYATDLDRLGMLSFDAWRACRLVVDTGLHAEGWSRAQAIEYMLANTLLSEPNVTNEVDRYIAWPGQALAYMLGRLEIERLRAEAEQRLGPRFELADFHDEVLRHGPLPLSVLGAELARWMDAVEAGG